jgi:hypothetical protein
MLRSIIAICILLIVGSITAVAATINIGYVIVTAKPLDNTAWLDLAVHTNNYPNPMHPVLTDVKIISASAQLYKGAIPFLAPLPWDASPGNPLTTMVGLYPLANNATFPLEDGVTRAVITFTVDHPGPWAVRNQPNFTPDGNLQYIAEITNAGLDLVGGLNASYANLAVTGEFAIPEPATTLLAFPVLAGLFLAVLIRKKI